MREPATALLQLTALGYLTPHGKHPRHAGGDRQQIRDHPDIRDPLASIAQIIRAEPHTPRTRMLTAILHGIATDKDEFSESEIYSLDHEALALVVLLTQEVLNGRYTEQELLRQGEARPKKRFPAKEKAGHVPRK